MSLYLLAYCLGGILLLILVVNLILYLWQREYPQKTEIKLDAQGEPPTPEKTKPTPTPASTKSYGWNWPLLIIAILVAIIAYHFIAPALRTSAPAPQATSATPPKKELRQPEDRRGLSLVGGDGIFEDKGFIGVRKGGDAYFATQTMPWRKDAVFHVVVKLLQKTTGNICLEVNGGRGGTKFYMHPGSSEFATVVFFETGEPGDSRYFNPGPNQVKIWSTVGDMSIQCVSMEMLY
jgi:hypothetical protein